jgi:hypothetical protein
MFQDHLPPLTNMLYLCLDIYARYFTNFYYPTFYIFVDESDKLFKDGDVCSIPDQHARMDFYIGSTLEKKRSTGRLDMSLHLDNLSWFRDNQSFFLLLECCVLSGEATNTNFKDKLQQSGAGAKKNDKKTNNGRQNTTQKTED